MTAPEPGGKSGFALSLVGRVLDYMQKPWQALAVIAILLLLGAGWLIWTERGELIAALRPRPPGPSVLKTDLLPEITGLLNDTTADLVSLWRVDWDTNTQDYLTSVKRGGGSWPPGAGPGGDGHLPALTPASNMQRVVKLLNGQSVCAALAESASNLLLRRLAQNGYRWACVVPVPPDPNAMTLALIYLAWAQRPDETHQTAARTLATAAAGHMITR